MTGQRSAIGFCFVVRELCLRLVNNINSFALQGEVLALQTDVIDAGDVLPKVTGNVERQCCHVLEPRDPFHLLASK